MRKGFLPVVLLLGSLFATPLWAKPYALLIGVGHYQSPHIQPLQGPVFDVLALRDVLVRYWRFKPHNIVTLIDHQANKRHILSALARLHQVTEPGDSVFIYYSGHGVNASQLAANIGLPLDSGAVLPFDTDFNGKRFIERTLLVGSRDLRPHLERLDKSGRQLFVVFDACYSAGGVRALDNPLAARSPVVWDKRNLLLQPRQSLQETYRHPYQNLFFISAAHLNQPARDIGVADLYRQKRIGTFDGYPHGAFTDAMLRVLGRPTRGLQYHDLYRSIQAQLKDSGFEQKPLRLPIEQDDSLKLGRHPVFARRSIQSDKAVVKPVLGPVLRLGMEGLPEPLRQRLLALPNVKLATKSVDVRIIAEPNGTWRLTGRFGDLLDRHIDHEQALLNRVRQYAWFHRLRSAEFNAQPFAFTLDLNAPIWGNEFKEGDLLRFNVKADRPFWLMLLYVNAHGDLMSLYPYEPLELKALAAEEIHAIPPTADIQVTPPFGTDLVIAAAFAEQPGFLPELVGKNHLHQNSDLFRQIEAALLNTQQLALRTLKLTMVGR